MNIPQPGESSKPPDFSGKYLGRKIVSLKQLQDIINHNDLVQYILIIDNDPNHPDRTTQRYLKVMEYAESFKKRPMHVTETTLPPLIIRNNQLYDGSHRVSAMLILTKTDPQWWDFKFDARYFIN